MINDDIVFDREAYEEHRRIIRTHKKTANGFRFFMTIVTSFIIAFLIFTVFLNIENSKYVKLNVTSKISDIDFSDIYKVFNIKKIETNIREVDDIINNKVFNVILGKINIEKTDYRRISNLNNFMEITNTFEERDVNRNTKSYRCVIKYKKNGKVSENNINFNYNLNTKKEISIDKIINSKKIEEFKNIISNEYKLQNPNINNFILDKNNITVYDFNGINCAKLSYDSIEKLVTNDVLTSENLTNYYSIFKVVVDPTKKMLALTFDDGPNAATTERILKTLTKYNAKATFFVLGNMADNYPNTIKKIVEQGSQIGNHTKSHLNLNLQNATTIANEINYTIKRVKEIANYDITVLRPPYGNANDTVKSIAKCPLILWNIDSLDWQSRNSQSIQREVLDYVNDGSIVLMHDIYSTTADAVEVIVPELIRRGYQLVTIDELFKYKGKEKIAGQKVYNMK